METYTSQSKTSLDAESLKELLLNAIVSPKRVKTDAGEVESHDLDKMVDALKQAQKLESATTDPFKCLRQSPIMWREPW